MTLTRKTTSSSPIRTGIIALFAATALGIIAAPALQSDQRETVTVSIPTFPAVQTTTTAPPRPTTTTTKPFSLEDLRPAVEAATKWIEALPKPTTTTTAISTANTAVSSGGGKVGGTHAHNPAPPVTGAIYVDTSTWDVNANCVMDHENSARVANRWYGRGISLVFDGKHTASGLFQIVKGTWGGYGGYTYAAYAPPLVQYERFKQLWAQWPGHWNGTRCPST